MNNPTLANRLRLLAGASALALTLSACGEATTNDATPATPKADKVALQSHLEFLADDALLGRDTGSDGHEIASNYIAAEFKKLGLQPAGDDGTYFQRVPFRLSRLVDRSAKFVVNTGDEDIELSYPKEF